MKVKYLKIRDGAKYNIWDYPNFSSTGSIKGMKDKYYGKDALLVRCGNYIYNVSSYPSVYYMVAR